MQGFIILDSIDTEKLIVTDGRKFINSNFYIAPSYKQMR